MRQLDNRLRDNFLCASADYSLTCSSMRFLVRSRFRVPHEKMWILQELLALERQLMSQVFEPVTHAVSARLQRDPCIPPSRATDLETQLAGWPCLQSLAKASMRFPYWYHEGLRGAVGRREFNRTQPGVGRNKDTASPPGVTVVAFFCPRACSCSCVYLH